MRRVALIALLAIAASACTIDVDIGILLDDEKSGTVSVDIAADEEFLELHRLTGREFEDVLASRGPALGLPFTVTPGTTTRFSAKSSPVSTQRLADILEGLAPGLGDVAFTTNESALEFDANLNALVAIDDVAPYFEGGDAAQFADDVDVTVTMSMPDDIGTSTGTVEGSRVTWKIPFSDTGARLLAASVVSKDRGPIPWSLVIGGGTLIGAVVFLIAIRSNITRTEETLTALPPSVAAPRAEAPEDQMVAPDATPPEDQPTAPPSGPN